MSRKLIGIVFPFFFLALLSVLLLTVIPENFPIPKGIIFWVIVIALFILLAVYAVNHRRPSHRLEQVTSCTLLSDDARAQKAGNHLISA